MYDPLVVDAFLRIHREQLRPESVPLPSVRELGLKMLSAEPTIN